MMTEPKTSSACLLSGSSAEIALLCLGIGPPLNLSFKAPSPTTFSGCA
jgi:hypothetical protein